MITGVYCILVKEELICSFIKIKRARGFFLLELRHRAERHRFEPSFYPIPFISTVYLVLYAEFAILFCLLVLRAGYLFMETDRINMEIKP